MIVFSAVWNFPSMRPWMLVAVASAIASIRFTASGKKARKGSHATATSLSMPSPSASAAAGYSALHLREQEEFIDEALGPMPWGF